MRRVSLVCMVAVWCVVLGGGTPVVRAERFRFEPDVTGPVPDEIVNDVLWDWKRPGLFGVVAPRGASSDDAGIGEAEIVLRDMQGREVLVTRTDDYGWFRFSCEPGHYRVLVRARGYLPLTTSAWPCVVSSGRAGQLRIPLDAEEGASLAARERTRTEVALFETNGPMCGLLLRVRTVEREDRVAGPVADATVVVLDDQGNEMRRFQSDEEGVVIVVLEPGPYGIFVEADGFARMGTGSEGVFVRRGEITLHAVMMLTDDDVAAGRGDRGGRSGRGEFSPPTPMAAETGIAGCVSLHDPRTQQQYLIEGAQVVVVADRGSLRLETRTAADGTFVVPLQSGGYYNLIVRKDGYTPKGEFVQSVRVRTGDLAEHDVPMTWLESLSAAEQAQREQLWSMYAATERKAGIRGFLYTRPPMGGQSVRVTDVEVVLYDADGYEKEAQYVDGQGEFTFAVEPGQYRVGIRSSEYRETNVRVSVRAGQVVSNGLNLRRLRRRR